MDWLHNPVADLSGPAFLTVYASCAVAIVIGVRLQARTPSFPERPLPPPTADADPRELAYLRGGGNGLLRFTIFDLVRRDALRFVPGKRPKDLKLVRGASPETAGLSPLERSLVDFFSSERAGEDVFGTQLAKEFAAAGEREYASKLCAEGFLRKPGSDGPVARAALLGAIFLLSLSAYRLTLAVIKHHHNIGFLVLMTILFPLLVLLAAHMSRVTARGRAFLTRLRTAYAPPGAAPIAAGAAALPLIVAIAGFDALAATPYAPMRTMFVRYGNGDGACGSSSDGSSCSGGGSGCGGGGGCGG